MLQNPVTTSSFYSQPVNTVYIKHAFCYQLLNILKETLSAQMDQKVQKIVPTGIIVMVVCVDLKFIKLLQPALKNNLSQSFANCHYALNLCGVTISSVH